MVDFFEKEKTYMIIKMNFEIIKKTNTKRYFLFICFFLVPKEFSNACETKEEEERILH